MKKEKREKENSIENGKNKTFASLNRKILKVEKVIFSADCYLLHFTMCCRNDEDGRHYYGKLLQKFTENPRSCALICFAIFFISGEEPSPSLPKAVTGDAGKTNRNRIERRSSDKISMITREAKN